jgi:lipoprotein Spr
MPVRRLFLLFTPVVICITFLSGCHTSRKLAAAPESGDPRFIDDMYIDHRHKNGTVYVKPVKKAPADDPYRRGGVIHKGSDEYNEPSTYSRRETKEVKRKYADILGVRPKDIDNMPLYEFIDKWYGTNYRLGGSEKSGVDCSGFAQKLYGEVYGLDLSRTAHEQFADSKHLKRIKKAEEGDLVFFHARGKKITHVGVYLANNFFVHASTSQGVIISSLNEEYWQKHFSGAGRVTKG